jgi:hypothetical protein
MLWLIFSVLILIVWVFTLVDIFRRGYSGWTMLGYIALIIVLPFIGSVIYWAVRKPTAAEAERAYLAETDMRRSTASSPIDRSGL